MTLNFDQLFSGGDSADTLVEPRKLFAALPNKSSKYSYLRDVQSDVLDSWYGRRDDKDLVVKMNTGGGKTVVGLLMLKASLNEGRGPAVYLCPDWFLVNQVIQEAKDLGIEVTTESKSVAVSRGNAILVVPVHVLFNGRSIFGVGSEGIKQRIGTLLIDDAHACIATAEKQFTVHLSGQHPAYKPMLELFAADLERQSPVGILDLKNGDTRRLMLVPYWAWSEKRSVVIDTLFAHRSTDELMFTWPLVSDHLHLCQCSFTGAGLEISSRCLPIEAIPSFEAAVRRIYMTATLSDDSVLITDFDVKGESVQNPITPKSASDMGDRMIVMPQELNPDLNDDEVREFVRQIAQQRNVVVIVPSDWHAAIWQKLGAVLLDASKLHEGVEKLKHQHSGLVVLSNKYDGIDLPHDACRLLVLDGLPEVRRYIDRYEQAVLIDADGILDRQIQKIEQGMGRGVRANDDYCVVMLIGAKLTQALFSGTAMSRFSPATKAQLDLSANLAKQISGKSLKELYAVFEHCWNRNPGWVRASRQALVSIGYYGDLKAGESATILRSAYSLAQSNQPRRAAEVFQTAVNQESDKKRQGWLKQQLAEYTHQFDPAKAQEQQLAACTLNKALLKPIEGIAYERLSAGRMSQALHAQQWLREKFKSGNSAVIWIHGLCDDLDFYVDDSKRFERAVSELGNLIGFAAQRPEAETGRGPDVLWAVGGLQFFVIECKNGATAPFIAKSDLDQILGSARWFESHYDRMCTVSPIIIHPHRHVDSHASPHERLRIIEREGLSKLKEELKLYGRHLSDGLFLHEVESLQSWLVNSKFATGKFLDAFTKEWRH